jgi:hypothetical protein
MNSPGSKLSWRELNSADFNQNYQWNRIGVEV